MIRHSEDYFCPKFRASSDLQLWPTVVCATVRLQFAPFTLLDVKVKQVVAVYCQQYTNHR